MSDNNYIEISPTLHAYQRWREIIIDTGAAQSTLHDFKLPESAGGYTFRDSNAWSTASCNRFIYWKTSNDIIELTEMSTDINLTGNQIKLRFQNTPVLEGISVHETPDQLYILVATVASVHRLSFPHPRKLGSVGTGSTSQTLSSSPRSLLTSTSLTGLELSRASIFFNASSENLHDPSNYSVLNSTIGSSLGLPIPITSCSWLTAQCEAVFVIANTAGSLLVVKLGSAQDAGKVISYELKQTTIIGRLWSGLVPSIIRGSQEGDEAAISIISHAIQDDYLIFALCRDLRIRMWSYKRQECLMVHYILQQSHKSGSTQKTHSTMIVRRPVILRKWSSGGDDSPLYLTAFVAGAENRQFLFFEPILDNGQYKLRSLATINAPEADLIDFCISKDEIWSLWLNSENSPVVLYCPIQSCSSWDWRQVGLHTQFTHKMNVNSILVDPRELYIQDIFWSGKFSLQTIAKAISIMSRISESSLMGCKVDILIEEATKIVENKLRNIVSANELSAEECRSLEIESWETLHSYCVQYHNVGNKPLGLFIDPKTALKGIIKKSSISFLRKSDSFDNAIINTLIENKMGSTLTCDDSLVDASLAVLLKCVNIITQTLTEDDMISFEAALARGDTAFKAASELVDNSLILATDPTSMNGDPLKNAFDNLFSKAPQLIEAIEVTHKALDLDTKESSGGEDLILDNYSTNAIFMSFLSSNSGLAVLNESVRQMSRLRFNFCRDLLLFQAFVVQIRNKDNLCNEVIERMHSSTIPLTSMFLHAYYFMTWVCETPMITSNISSITPEDSAAHLSLLELHDYINVNRRGVSTTASLLFDVGPRSILNYFIQNHGGVLAKKLLSYKISFVEEPVTSLEIWSTIMPQYVISVAQIIWPISTQFKLAEFLLGFGQYQLLQQYISLLDIWCVWNACSRQFLQAFCHLILDDAKTAVPLFNKSIFGINDELFLQSIFIGQQAAEQTTEENNEALTSATVFKYYNKLLQLFTLYSPPDGIIELVNSAVCMLDESEDDQYSEHMSSLYSTLFMCHLELGNADEAYEAMILNPDMSQKKVCLRQFIINHCEPEKLVNLTAYTYNDIEDEYINIIESRARSTDLLISNEINYYYLLYAYFVKQNNYRRAASVMYEYFTRLSQEVPGIESIKKQVTCSLVTINCLKIVNPKYSWIVKPTARKLAAPPVAVKSKRKHETADFNDVWNEEMSIKRSVEVMDVNDIKCEYELLKARLRLLQRDEKAYAIANMPLSCDETVSVLISASLYDLAFHISTIFKLSYEPIFEGIVSKYIYLVHSGENFDIVEVYDCFVDNDTASLGFINCAKLSPLRKMWHLISAYIDTYEVSGQTVLHKCVANKLLSNGISIPVSLKLKYQKQNCPELLRLLIHYDFIEDAFNLSLEYLRAFMGRGTEYFDINYSLVLPKTPPLYIPYHLFNTLLRIFDEEKTVPEFKEMHAKLSNELRRLRELCMNVSKSSSL